METSTIVFKSFIVDAFAVLSSVVVILLIGGTLFVFHHIYTFSLGYQFTANFTMTPKVPLHSQTMITGRSRKPRTRVTPRPAPFTSKRAQELAVALGHMRKPPGGQEQQQQPIEGNDPDVDPRLAEFMPMDYDPASRPSSSPEPTALDLFAQQCRGWQHAEKQRESQKIWDGLEAPMTAAYLYCQHASTNWTQAESFDISCACIRAEKSTREVDLIDVLGRHHLKELTFCSCLSDPVRLLYYGYFASTPTSPRTAFSIPLIQFHHHLWNSSGISATAMMEALMAFHDQRSSNMLFVRTGDYSSRNLRRPFTQAVDLYRRIMTHQTTLHDDLLRVTTADKWAAECSRCFGPSEGEVKESADEPDAIVAMDGNFQHRHQIHASKDTPTDQDYPKSFISPAQIEQSASALRTSENQVKDLKTPCSDSHTAANDVRNSTSWDRCDDTGLFACACRHDVPLQFVNIYKSGEKLHYPVSILDKLLTELPDMKLGVLYDIACHLQVHVNKRNLLSQHKGRLLYGTSVFHAYAHQWRCQIFFNPRFIKFFGLSDGEGLERVWSDLSVLVSSLRISTRLHRLLSIHWRASYFKQKVTQGSGKWLYRRLHNALEVRFQSGRALTELEAFVHPDYPERRYNSDFFRVQWVLEREAHSSKKVSEHEMQLELARLLCLEEELGKFWQTVGNQLPPSQALVRLQTHEKLQKSIEDQRAKIGRANLVGLTDNNDENKKRLKVWYGKHDIRLKYLALCAEKRPLEDSRVPGKKSKLGTHGKTALLASLRKHAAKLFQACQKYNERVSDYQRSFPHQAFSPAPIIYKDLHEIAADDPFWNDGLFTNPNEPWATDPHTQRGMRQLAYFERSNEEIRRIGWEVRRSMRWASSRYQALFDTLLSLKDAQKRIEDFDNPLPPDSLIARFIQHSSLNSILVISQQPVAVTTLFYNSFIDHTHLMELWDNEVLKVFSQTPHQLGDDTVLSLWKHQMLVIRHLRKEGLLSRVLGDWNGFYSDIHKYVGEQMEDVDDIPELVEDNGTTENESTHDDEDDEEDQWIKTLDDEVLRLTLDSNGMFEDDDLN